MIRSFTLQDLNAILDIERQSFPKSPYDRMTFLELHTLYPQQFLVYTETGPDSKERILGYIVFNPEGHIISLAVLPGRRREGIGKKLLRKAMEASPPRGLSAEVRRGNLGAQAFYFHMGFRAIGVIPNYYGDEDALVIRWGPSTFDEKSKGLIQ